MLQCGLSGLLPNISKVEDYAKWLNPQAKQTAGKDFVYPLSKRQKPETQNEELSEQQLSTSVPKYIQSFVQRINLIYSFLLSVPYTPLLFKSWMLFIFGWKSETMKYCPLSFAYFQFSPSLDVECQIFISLLWSPSYICLHIFWWKSVKKNLRFKNLPKNTLVFLVDFSVTLFVLDIPVIDWKSIWIGCTKQCVKCTPKKKVIFPSWYDSPFSCWMNVMSFSVWKYLLHMLLFRWKF